MCPVFLLSFLLFVLVKLKPFVLKGKVRGDNSEKGVKKCEESANNSETILPFSCCPFNLFSDSTTNQCKASLVPNPQEVEQKDQSFQSVYWPSTQGVPAKSRLNRVAGKDAAPAAKCQVRI